MIQSRRQDAPVKQLCSVFELARSSYYYRPVERDERAVLSAIEQVLVRRPWFGYRRVLAQLQREGVQVKSGSAVAKDAWAHLLAGTSALDYATPFEFETAAFNDRSLSA